MTCRAPVPSLGPCFSVLPVETLAKVPGTCRVWGYRHRLFLQSLRLSQQALYRAALLQSPVHSLSTALGLTMGWLWPGLA